MSKDKKEHPSAHAFLTNPVASANEFTGYGARMPMSDDEADSLSDMLSDVPTEESRMGVDVPKKYKTGNILPKGAKKR